MAELITKFTCKSYANNLVNSINWTSYAQQRKVTSCTLSVLKFSRHPRIGCNGLGGCYPASYWLEPSLDLNLYFDKCYILVPAGSYSISGVRRRSGYQVDRSLLGAQVALCFQVVWAALRRVQHWTLRLLHPGRNRTGHLIACPRNNLRTCHPSLGKPQSNHQTLVWKQCREIVVTSKYTSERLELPEENMFNIWQHLV